MRTSSKCFLTAVLALISIHPVLVHAQDAMTLVEKVKAKLDKVNNYVATGMLKTNVPFLKVPESQVQVYYKKPDHFRIKKQQGISIVPRGGISINLYSLFADNHYTAVPAGLSTVDNVPVSIVKLLPLDEKSDVVLATLYIDGQQLLIRKASITTRNNGTYEIEMSYGKYAGWGLPDRVLFSFNTKDYKLPKGVIFDYEGGNNASRADTAQNQVSTIAITYKNYVINKGVGDSIFQ